MKPQKMIGWIVLGVVGFLALVALLGVALMLLWNWRMPVIFGSPVLSYWQAVGLLALAHLLFKGGLPHRPPIEYFHKKHGPPPFAHRVREHLHGERAEAEAPAE